jgi:uncharacterized protein (TIGR02145 family)
MKKLLIIISIVLGIFIAGKAQVSVNTTGNPPDNSAMLDVQAINKGFLPPRMSDINIANIQNPATGLMVFTTDANLPLYFNGTKWNKFDGNEYFIAGYSTITDYDNNVYQTVAIGNQIWMRENLKVIHYRNGDPIPDGTGIGNYSAQFEPKYYFSCDDNINNVPIYGRLYTWYAATDANYLCPTGWHLPTDNEWTILTTYLGGESIARYKMKEIGTTHWNAPNTGATNESGFTGLPGGYSSSYGDFQTPGVGGFFWSGTTHSNPDNAWSRVLYYNDAAQMRLPEGNGKKLGLSVRCLKD